ncbi:MAG: MotA/TolQ/ExbB proton channel family protein, partial [Planctomycetota bacterium]
GEKIAVTALYMGIGQAFYASSNGEAAGVGSANSDGWFWRPANESAEAITKLIAVHEGSQAAEFVPVPVRVDWPKRKQAMKKHIIQGAFLALLLHSAGLVFAQESNESETPTPTEAVEEVQETVEASITEEVTSPALGGINADLERQLQEAVEELAALRAEIAENQIPLSRELGRLEAELSELRGEASESTSTLDRRVFDLTKMQTSIQAKKDEANYLSNLLGDYIREFESRIHISEFDRYEAELDAVKRAAEDESLTPAEIFERQAAVLSMSIDRLNDALGGARFEGTAIDEDGFVKQGTFVLLGPAALFRSEDGRRVGTVEQRGVDFYEPTVIPFANPETAALASSFVETGEGTFPMDPTLGKAHKIEATNETFLEHVKKGGPIMYPLFGMAALAALIAVFKWLSFLFVRKPSRKKVRALYAAIEENDEKLSQQRAAAIRGPVGRMLQAGAKNLSEPRELIEEVMYEQMLTSKMKLNGLLPFIAICAASAPLLGLLGTVTGIIDTFKLITVEGAGDPKALSGGISEALITTKFGLIVAIPCLLVHSFLSRKARGLVGKMESSGVGFINAVSKAQNERARTEGTLEPVAAARITTGS